MHKLLQKQLKKLGYPDTSLPEGYLDTFLQNVSQTYTEADEDRIFLEHTLETISQEMEELFNELKEKSQTQLAKSEQKYRELARKDMLTGVFNRYAFDLEFEKLISSAKRTSSQFALVFLDLDNFKEVNDTYGHDVGDSLLQEITNRVIKNIRIEDIFARMGGDEFVLVFTNIEKENIKHLVEKAISLFREEWLVDEIQLDVTVSMGISMYPENSSDKLELMKQADKAMYKSKELGRNQVVYCSDLEL